MILFDYLPLFRSQMVEYIDRRANQHQIPARGCCVHHRPMPVESWRPYIFLKKSDV